MTAHHIALILPIDLITHRRTHAPWSTQTNPSSPISSPPPPNPYHSTAWRSMCARAGRDVTLGLLDTITSYMPTVDRAPSPLPPPRTPEPTTLRDLLIPSCAILGSRTFKDLDDGIHALVALLPTRAGVAVATNAICAKALCSMSELHACMIDHDMLPIYALTRSVGAASTTQHDTCLLVCLLALHGLSCPVSAHSGSASKPPHKPTSTPHVSLPESFNLARAPHTALTHFCGTQLGIAG